MKLARMLMVRKDSRHTATDMFWHEQEGLDALIRLHRIFDSLSHVRATIGCFQTHSIKWAPLWKGAKKPFQIIAVHDRKHLARRPLVNSAPGSQTAVWPVVHPLLLRCMSLLLARSCQFRMSALAPLLEHERTLTQRFAGLSSTFAH